MKSIEITILLFLITPLVYSDFVRHCKADSDCPPYYNCLDGKTCEYDGILSDPLTGIVGFIGVLIAITLGNAAGVGGGPLIIPIFIMLFHFRAKEAAPLSAFTIFPGVVLNLFSKFKLTHPLNPHRPVIDLGLTAILMPALQIGTMIGVIFAKSFSTIFSMMLLVMFLFVNLFTTGLKAKKMYLKEGEIIKRHSKKLNPMRKKPLEKSKSMEIVLIDLRSDFQKELVCKEIVFSQDLEQNYLTKNVAIIISVFLASLLLALLQGNQNYPSFVGVSFCGGIYWSLYVIFIVFCVFVQYISLKWNQNGILLYLLSNHDFPCHSKEEALKLQSSELAKLVFAGFIAGIFASLMGVGGGIIINPIMNEFGIPAPVGNACSIVIVVITSLSSSIQYLLIGQLKLYPNGIVFGIISVVGGFFGSVLYKIIMTKFNRNSYLLIILFITFCFSFIVMTIYTTTLILERGEEGFTIESPCYIPPVTNLNQILLIKQLYLFIIYQNTDKVF